MHNYIKHDFYLYVGIVLLVSGMLGAMYEYDRGTTVFSDIAHQVYSFVLQK